MRNTTDEFSWGRAEARSVDGVIEDTACSIHEANRIGYEALIERIIPETVDVNTINIVMNSADKKLRVLKSQSSSGHLDPESRPT